MLHFSAGTRADTQYHRQSYTIQSKSGAAKSVATIIGKLFVQRD